MPRVDPLKLVAGSRRKQQHEDVGHRGDRGFRLPHTDRLDDDDIESRRLHDPNRFPSAPCDSPERGAGGRRTDERARVDREAFHSCLVAENRAAGHGGGRVDGEHRELVAAIEEERAEGLDERRLSDPWRPGQPDAQRMARVMARVMARGMARGMARRTSQTFQEIGRGRLVIGAGGLDEGDGPGDGPAVRAPHPPHQLLDVRRRHAAPPRGTDAPSPSRCRMPTVPPAGSPGLARCACGARTAVIRTPGSADRPRGFRRGRHASS